LLHKSVYTTIMALKQRFQLVIEPGQLAALRAIEAKTGARISEQIRRAVDAYLETQKVLPKAELKKLREA
jgi:hypothetical protein